MSDKSIPSRQSQSKHKIYYFKTGVLVPAGQGAAPSNPYKEGTVRLRPYKDEEKEPMGKYLSANDQRLLIDYGARTHKGEFGADAKYMYIDLAERLETSTDKAVDVKEILKLLGVIDLKGKESDHNIRIALQEAFPESKVIKNLYPEMKKAQTKSKSSSMNDPPKIDNTDVPPNESILVEKTSLFRDIQGDLGGSEKRKALEKQKTSRSASREKGSSRPTDPDYMDKIDETIHEYRDDPTDSTKMMDSGGAVIDYRDESLGKKTLIPSQPSAKDTDSDVPQDLQNLESVDYGMRRDNTYRIPRREAVRREDIERRADESEFDYMTRQLKLLGFNPLFEGGGTDVTGAGRGGEEDLVNDFEQTAPASYNLTNPKETMKSKQPRQARDGSIDPEMGGVSLTDYNVRRTPTNAGMNEEGLTPRQQIENDDPLRDRRLIDRASQTRFLNTANSQGSAGSGIMGEITDLVDLQNDDDDGRRPNREGLHGARGGIYNGDGSDPYTMAQRFETIGQRRQGQKIDKYVNMKNRGMMYSNLMGKGVSDPSIQSIRDRKDDYIQPNGQHKGNSVNLIRQSNATSIRLNNMYMP